MERIRSIILWTLMSIVCTTVSAAEAVDDSNVIYTKSASVHPTDEAEIHVFLNNRNYGVKSLQFTIVLPDGVDFVAKGKNYKYKKTDALDDDWTVTARTKSGEDSHSAIVMVYNVNDDSAVLPIGDREILSLTTVVGESMPVGNYNITVKAVTLTSEDNTEHTYASYASKSDVTVSALLVSSITIDKTTLTIDALQKSQLSATVLPEKAAVKDIVWSTSNDKVVKVSQDGTIEAVMGGEATVTATAKDGSGVTASCKVTVVNPRFLLTYEVDGTVYSTDSVTFGTAITPVDTPTKDGYTFSGWSGVPTTMPAKDVVVRGSFTTSLFVVKFIVDGKTVFEEARAYGTKIEVPTVENKEGYSFSGFGEVEETVPAHDVTYTGSYTINKYKVMFVADGKTVSETEMEYGAAIVAPDAPAKEGYTFTGWGDVEKTVPAHDVTYTGSYTVNKYKLTYEVDGTVYSTDSVTFGTAITPVDTPTKDGYTFSGWSGVPTTMPAKDVTVTGTFIANPIKEKQDVNCDGYIDSQDVLQLYEAIKDPNSADLEMYDINGDGIVDTQDVLNIYDYMKENQ